MLGAGNVMGGGSSTRAYVLHHSSPPLASAALALALALHQQLSASAAL